MPKSFTFNGIRKSWLHMTRGRTKPLFTPIRRNTLTTPGMEVVYLSSSETEAMPFSQPIAFTARDDEHALQIKDELAEWLITKEPAPLEFDDEPGRTYFAVVQNTIEDFERIGILRQGSINFLCLDPYGYGPKKTEAIPNDAAIVQNKGTAEADPIFELEVLAPVTFAMIQNENDEYMLIGKPTAVDEEVVDTKTLLLEERGQTLDTWLDKPTSVDGGVVAGSLSTDNDGITVPSYGPNTNNWHGPALIKEVTPAQDFEVEMMLQGRTTSVNQTFRIEFYLFDEGMNQLGKMAIKDDSLGIHRKKAEGRLGTYEGLGERYLISSQNYSYDQDYFYGMLRMRRVGTRISFYVTRINNNSKHVQSFGDMTYVDGDYLGKLKYIQIHIGKYGDTERAYAPKIDHIKVFELAEATVDQTPYIARPGDKIVFDHTTDEILLNGEDATELKDFGGSYFKLAKGSNQLVVHPGASFNTNVRYRNKYR